MADLPEPFVPPHVDLRGYGWMPLHGPALFGSEFNAKVSDKAWRAGVTLWWMSWNQVPAASLPDDDVALARLAEYGKDVKSWKKIREEALHGFVRCSDGRLYHRFLAREAVDAWARREKERKRKAKWRDAKERKEREEQERQERLRVRSGDGDISERDGDRDVPGTADRTRQDRTGQDLPLNPQSGGGTNGGNQRPEVMLADDFVRLRGKHWPDHPTFPSPTMMLEQQAAHWLSAGLPATAVLEVVERVMVGNVRVGKPPPPNFGFCKLSLETALAAHHVEKPHAAGVGIKIAAITPEAAARRLERIRNEYRGNVDKFGQEVADRLARDEWKGLAAEALPHLAEQPHA